MSIAREIVGFAIKAGSSDIHLEEESPIAVRVNSEIKVSPQNLRSEDMDQLLQELMDTEKLNEFNNTGDLDTSIGLEGLSRLRINAYVANQKRCLTLRILPDDLPRWQDLGLPQPFIELSKIERGLVLCTGPTGSGKTTIGNLLSKELDYNFFDIDQIIEKNYKTTISNFFEIYGEKKFRETESSILKKLNGGIISGHDGVYINV